MLEHKGNWTVNIYSPNIQFEQSEYEIDTDDPVTMNFAISHTGFGGQLRFVDEELLTETDVLDFISIEIDGEPF